MNEGTVEQVAQPIQQRWQEALSEGFLVVPAALLNHQDQLGLDNAGMVVLMHLLAAWWYEDNLPYPSLQTIARRMGASVRTVQRHLDALEENGLVERKRNQLSNTGALVTRYDPSGVVARVRALAHKPPPGRTENR